MKKLRMLSGLPFPLHLKKNIDEMREELIHFSEEGKLERTVAYLKKTNKKPIRRIHIPVYKTEG